MNPSNIERIWVIWFVVQPKNIGKLNFSIGNEDSINKYDATSDLKWDFGYKKLIYSIRRKNHSLQSENPFYHKVNVIASKKFSLTAIDRDSGFSDSYLEIFFWNTGLIALHLNTASIYPINHSFFWERIKWSYGKIKDTLFGHADRFIQQYIQLFGWTGEFSTLTKTLIEPDLIIVHGKIDQTLQNKCYIYGNIQLEYDHESIDLNNDWDHIKFDKIKNIELFIHHKRKYLFLLMSKETTISKRVRDTLMYAVEFFLGHKKWLLKLSTDISIFDDLNDDLLNFFLYNLHPARILEVDNSIFDSSMLQPILENYFQKHKYSEIYYQIESQLASGYSLRSETVRYGWLVRSSVMKDGPLLKELAKPLNPDDHEIYKDILDDPLVLFAFAVVAQKYKDIKLSFKFQVFGNLEEKMSATIPELIKQSTHLENTVPEPQSFFAKLSETKFSKDMIYNKHPLDKLAQRSIVDKRVKTRPGRPRLDTDEQGVSYILTKKWQDLPRLEKFFRLQ